MKALFIQELNYFKSVLPAAACPVVLEHTSYVPSGTTPIYKAHILVRQRQSCFRSAFQNSPSSPSAT